MGYGSRRGRKPIEAASKAAHHHIVNDPAVRKFLERCWTPSDMEEISLSTESVFSLGPVGPNPIRKIIAIDGGYTETYVKETFPSSSICFLQFGALLLETADLRELEEMAFIAPEDMSRLRNIERWKLALPTKNVRLSESQTFCQSVRKTIFEFFCGTLIEGKPLIDTLAWFLFRRYLPNQERNQYQSWRLATNPNDPEFGSVAIREKDLSGFAISCPSTERPIYLTDVFRLHEVIDDEVGARGILGYLVNTIEHMILVHCIRYLLETKPEVMHQVLFIKDGPLGFFGQTARMHVPMRDLVRYLASHHAIFMVGLEKSGAFVEHAEEIAGHLDKGSAILLSNEYIYRHILPGQADPARPYGATTNFGHKVIFRTNKADMYVASIPSTDVYTNPQPEDLINLGTVLRNLELLRCDMYESSLVPVALVNKLVSLSDHPSKKILQKFASSGIRGD